MKLQGANLIVASGAFSYIGSKTLLQVYDAVGADVEFLGWPTCSTEVGDLLNVLRAFHSTIELGGTFPMRDFATAEEADSYFNALPSLALTNRLVGDNKLSVFRVNARQGALG